MKLITAGRTDTSDFFPLSGIRTSKVLSHTPVLVFVPQDDTTIKVVIVSKPVDLLDYPDDTQAMMQWEGQRRSDFFQFTIGQLRQFIVEHPKEGRQVI